MMPAAWYEFRWIAFNVAKVDKHGLPVVDVEYVVNHARKPFPMRQGSEKHVVNGPTVAGLWIVAIYLIDGDGTLFVIHARPLTADERREAQRRIAKRK